MDLRELGYFIAVYEEGSVSAAARRSFISQPSVSTAIATLETELGTKLFLRHRRGATPTASAAQLYPTARRMVDDARALRAAFRAPPATRRITIGVLRSIDVHRVRELLLAITQAPDPQLRLVGPDDRCDVRIVSRGMVRPAETFVALWSERFVVALPATHPLALRATLCAADLVGQRLVERCHCEYAQRAGRGLQRLDPVAVAESEEWALALVGAGVGLAIVPEGVVRGDPHVVVRALRDVSASRQVGLAIRARTSPDVQRLCEQLQRRFGATSRRRRKPG